MLSPGQFKAWLGLAWLGLLFFFIGPQNLCNAVISLRTLFDFEQAYTCCSLSGHCAESTRSSNILHVRYIGCTGFTKPADRARCRLEVKTDLSLLSLRKSGS
jgi:hypothetical protein